MPRTKMPRTARKKNKATTEPKRTSKKDIDDLEAELKKKMARLESVRRGIEVGKRLLRTVEQDDVQAGERWRFKYREDDEGGVTVLRMKNGRIHYTYNKNNDSKGFTESLSAKHFFKLLCKEADYDNMMRDMKDFKELCKEEE